MKENYQLKLEKELNHIITQEKVPTLLLHSCCAPCSSYVLEYLSRYFMITILYYNPNIYPEEEYQRRSLEQKEFIRKLKTKYLVHLVIDAYDSSAFYQTIKGLEKEKEGGQRCFKCYQLRMEKAAKYAHDHHFDYFTTTLSISPYKNSTWINEIGSSLQETYHTTYLYADFKKKNGYKRSIELSLQYGLYRQDYCGCVYSKLERAEKIKA